MPFSFEEMSSDDAARVATPENREIIRRFGLFRRRGAWVVDRERNLFGYNLCEVHPRYARQRYILSVDDELAVIEIDPRGVLHVQASLLYLAPPLAGRRAEVEQLFAQAFATVSPEMGCFGLSDTLSLTFAHLRERQP